MQFIYHTNKLTQVYSLGKRVQKVSMIWKWSRVNGNGLSRVRLWLQWMRNRTNWRSDELDTSNMYQIYTQSFMDMCVAVVRCFVREKASSFGIRNHCNRNSLTRHISSRDVPLARPCSQWERFQKRLFQRGLKLHCRRTVSLTALNYA